MFGTVHLIEYLIGVIFIILLPGPNSMYCLTVAAQSGHSKAISAIVGIVLGDSILILTTVFGAGVLLQTMPSLFLTLKIIGGLYLMWLGLKMLYAAYLRYHQNNQAIQQSQVSVSGITVFKNALYLSLTNPKAILFFLSFFVQFVDPNYPYHALSFLVLAVILQLVSISYLFFIAYMGATMRHFFVHQQMLSVIAYAFVGFVFCAFAMRLWLAQL